MDGFHDPDDADPFIPAWEGAYTDAQLLRIQLEEAHVPVELDDANEPGRARVMVPRSYIAEVRDVISGNQARWPQITSDAGGGSDIDPRLRLAFAAMAVVVVVAMVLAAVL